MQSQSSVAIFDSGLGGLTVMREIMQLLPYEDLIYFGDMARVPYGGRGSKTIVRYALECIRFLMKRKIKCLVIACHTVSAYALQDLAREFGLPMLGVIEPLVQELCKTDAKQILILGTKATIASYIYPKLILEKKPSLKISSIAAPLFVPFVEEGLIHHPACDLVVQEYLKPLAGQKIDAALLACTHYPLIKKAIQKCIGRQVTLIEAGPPTAHALFDLLANKLLLSPPRRSKLSFIVTDHREKFCSHAAAFLNRPIDPHDVEEVDLCSL